MNKSVLWWVSGLLLVGVVACSNSDDQGRTTGQSSSGAVTQQGSSQERLSGKISSIDREQGMVNVAARDQTYKLHFPPSSLSGLSDGDNVTLQVAFRHGAQQGPSQAFDAPGPPALARQSVIGKVKDINRDKGQVSFEADDKTMQLFFPPQSIQSLNKGDQITVDVALYKGDQPSSGQPGQGGMPQGGGSRQG